jgi:hypothetical protein
MDHGVPDPVIARVVRQTGFQAVGGVFVPPGRSESFVFVPASGPITLGYDPAAFHPSADLVDSYQEDARLWARDAGEEPTEEDLDIHRFIQAETSPLRQAEIGPLLAMVTAVPARDLRGSLPGNQPAAGVWTSQTGAAPPPDLRSIVQRWLAELGATLPDPDTWEYLYGAGTRTLWPWGDTCDPPAGWAGNPFGLDFNHDPCEYEFTSDPLVFCGGDGGGSGSDWGDFVQTFPQATAYRSPDGAALADTAEDLGRVRAVIML